METRNLAEALEYAMHGKDFGIYQTWGVMTVISPDELGKDDDEEYIREVKVLMLMGLANTLSYMKNERLTIDLTCIRKPTEDGGIELSMSAVIGERPDNG